MSDARVPATSAGGLWPLFLIFLRLGCVAFGGPVAHLALFRRTFVDGLGWLEDGEFGRIVSLCQLLPGPSSSQAGMAIGAVRGGVAGSLVAWLGFTLPSAAIMTAAALGSPWLNRWLGPGWLHGLAIAVLAVVAQASWSMAHSLSPDPPRRLITLLVALLSYVWPTSGGQVAGLATAALLGSLSRAAGEPLTPVGRAPQLDRRHAAAFVLCYLGLLAVAWALARSPATAPLQLCAALYSAGALVFGGGHVVLPLLQGEVARHGWLSQAQLLAGYGLVQAVPGPLFSVSAYVGASVAGLSGAALAVAAIFLPGWLLLMGALPVWHALETHPGLQGARRGVEAGVVGLLLASLLGPIRSQAIGSWTDAALAALAVLALMRLRWPPWVIVPVLAAAGALLAR